LRVTFVGYAPADPEGTAAGRQLYAVGEALRADGHDVEAWSWSFAEPAATTAAWCEWRPLPAEPGWRLRARSAVRPRSRVRAARWAMPTDRIVIADDPASWPAVSRAAQSPGVRAVASVHFAVRLDRAALHDWSAAHLQDLRAERRLMRSVRSLWTLSERVQDALGAPAGGGRSVVVPATLPMPAEPLPPVDAPVVSLLANWQWPANVAAARALFTAWPDVRARVPGARLVLAGRGASPVGDGSRDGVEWRGEVPRAVDLLAETAVLAFPCPPTSGPKMKVLEALAYGVPVLTTPAGVEGITGGADAATVVTDGALTESLVRLLSDPERRAQASRRGREIVRAGHEPTVAARARVAALAAGPGATA
jgi:hypothetical protein